MEFETIEELIKYLDNEFIPTHIKRRLNNNPNNSDTLDIYYINYCDIYELYLDDEILEYVINYISNLGIYIDNSLDDNISITNRKYYYGDKNIDDMFILLNNSKNKDEYYKIRDEIFYIYLDFAEYMLNRVIVLYDVPKEDLKSDIYLAILEAIEKYDFSIRFSTYLNNYIKRYLSKKYSIMGANILDIESTEYNNECKENLYYLYRNNAYEAFTQAICREPEDIYDIDLVDDFYLDTFFDRIDYNLLSSYIINLKIDKYYHKDVFERDKMYFMLYYGIGYDRRYTVLEIADIVGRLHNVISARIRHFSQKLVERIQRESYINGEKFSVLRRNYIIKKSKNK